MRFLKEAYRVSNSQVKILSDEDFYKTLPLFVLLVNTRRSTVTSSVWTVIYLTDRFIIHYKILTKLTSGFQS